MPLIFGGIRSAALQVVATATIAAYVGLGGLGRYVFDGLALHDYPQMAGGAILVAVLAVLVELVLTGVQRLVVSPGCAPGEAEWRNPEMKRTVAGLVTVLVAALGLTACGGGGGGDPLAGGNSGSQSPSDTITVGSANFPESQLLAEIYAAALTKAGVKVSKKLNIGSRETYIPALKDGSIDLIPEYSGVLLQYFDKTRHRDQRRRRVHGAGQGAAQRSVRVGQVGGRGQGRHRRHQGDGRPSTTRSP